jgi:hypothetical protein
MQSIFSRFISAILIKAFDNTTLRAAFFQQGKHWREAFAKL